MSLRRGFLGLGARSAQGHEEEAHEAGVSEVRVVMGTQRTKGEDMFGRSSEDRLREKGKEPQAAPRLPQPEERIAPPPPREGPQVVAAPPAAGEVHAYFGKGSRISGKLNFEGTVRLDGKVEGEIYAKDTLIIGESAEVTAEIRATQVTIRGLVRGDVHALAKLEILPPGRLYGNIETPSLVVGEGVIFEGTCLMESQARKDEKKVTPLAQGARAERTNEAAG